MSDTQQNLGRTSNMHMKEIKQAMVEQQKERQIEKERERKQIVFE